MYTRELWAHQMSPQETTLDTCSHFSNILIGSPPSADAPCQSLDAQRSESKVQVYSEPHFGTQSFFRGEVIKRTLPILSTLLMQTEPYLIDLVRNPP